MSKNDVFVQEFRQLLAGIPEKANLAQWQHMYRQAIIEMGLTIGERFKNQAAAASIPREVRVGVKRGNPIEVAASGGYHGPGPRYVLQLADYALSIGEH